MSAPNAGRQSPEPETQTPDQQSAHPGQPGSGKVSEIQSYHSDANHVDGQLREQKRRQRKRGTNICTSW